jgi:hypothetical protein
VVLKRSQLQRRSYLARSQSGSSLLEFSIVFVFVLFLILAIMEVGYNFYIRESVSRMAKTGAREAAVQGSHAQADYNILNAMKRDTTLTWSQVDHVVIYRASESDPQSFPNPSCDSQSIENVCNYYSKTDVANYASLQFGCSDLGGARHFVDYNFCPFPVPNSPITGRKDTTSSQQSASFDTELIGVYIQYDANSITGISMGSAKIGERAFAKVEPANYG